MTRFGCVAADYKNEAEVGEALKEAFDSGLVKREDLFITTKVSFTTIHVDLSCLFVTFVGDDDHVLSEIITVWPFAFESSAFSFGIPTMDTF